MIETRESPASAVGNDLALELKDVTAGYGASTILRDVNLRVAAGSVVALLGANGAGKTTLLKTAAGLLTPSSGSVHLAGVEVTDQPAFRRRRAGLCLIPEGRGIFPNLSVAENLRVQLAGRRRAEVLDTVFTLFPVLKDRQRQLAGAMSGGQQQMLALARAYLGRTDLVLVDEVSMGLAPIVVDQVYEALNRMREQRVAIVLVEQYVDRALEIADNVYTITRGAVSDAGAPSAIDRQRLMDTYLGVDDAEVATPDVSSSHQKVSASHTAHAPNPLNRDQGES